MSLQDVHERLSAKSLSLYQGAGRIAAWTVHTATFGLRYGRLCYKAFKATYPCAPDGTR